MDDWDLQAVVRGYTNSEEFADMFGSRKTSMFASPLRFDEADDSINLLSRAIEPSRGDFNDLDDLFKPFCPKLRQFSASPKSFWSSVIPASVTKQESLELPVFQKESTIQANISQSSDSNSYVLCSPSHAATWKRRKNEQKRVVQELTADRLSSDMWAWRKYGQKPIKGSPYPRSYYRCSSQKGCLARKQVERSSTNPLIFIVTYTAEHSHPQPPRRNALAGSTRVKSLSSDSKKITITLPPLIKHIEDSLENPSIVTVDDMLAQPSATKEDRNISSMESIGTMFPPERSFAEAELYPSLDEFDDLLFV